MTYSTVFTIVKNHMYSIWEFTFIYLKNSSFITRNFQLFFCLIFFLFDLFSSLVRQIRGKLWALFIFIGIYSDHVSTSALISCCTVLCKKISACDYPSFQNCHLHNYYARMLTFLSWSAVIFSHFQALMAVFTFCFDPLCLDWAAILYLLLSVPPWRQS